jgi:hypothetical protein
MYCNLTEDSHVSARFYMIIDEMAKDFPSYELLDGGQSYTVTTLFQKLWQYHLCLIRKWKNESPTKFQKSKSSSNSKSTADSSNLVKQGKTG